MKLTRTSTWSQQASSRRSSVRSDGEPLPAVNSHGMARPVSGDFRCRAQNCEQPAVSEAVPRAGPRCPPAVCCLRWTSSALTRAICRFAFSAPSPSSSSSSRVNCLARASAIRSDASSGGSAESVRQDGSRRSGNQLRHRFSDEFVVEAIGQLHWRRPYYSSASGLCDKFLRLILSKAKIVRVHVGTIRIGPVP